MTNICVTYLMKRENEVAETCITLPMEEKKADELLAAQSEWWQLMDGATLDVLLRKLSILQGYQFAGFETAEKINQ